MAVQQQQVGHSCAPPEHTLNECPRYNGGTNSHWKMQPWSPIFSSSEEPIFDQIEDFLHNFP